jgi:Zn-dependent protease
MAFFKVRVYNGENCCLQALVRQHPKPPLPKGSLSAFGAGNNYLFALHTEVIFMRYGFGVDLGGTTVKIAYFEENGDKSLLINVYKGVIANRIYAGQFSDVGVYAQVTWLMYVQRLFLMLAQMNLGLAVFNLIPVPPLDGSRIFLTFLPAKYYFGIMKYEKYIMLAVLVLVYIGVFDGPLATFMQWIYNGMARTVTLLPIFR